MIKIHNILNLKRLYRNKIINTIIQVNKIEVINIFLTQIVNTIILHRKNKLFRIKLKKTNFIRSKNSKF